MANVAAIAACVTLCSDAWALLAPNYRGNHRLAKLIDCPAGSVSRWVGMPSAGFAPATSPTRAIVGPVSTAFGFRCWYLACFPDVIMAVPQSFFAAVAFVFSSETRPIVFGVLQQLIADLITGPGRRLRSQRAATLSRTPESQIRSTPNVAIPVAQIRSISFKTGLMASHNAVVTPEIILETVEGKKRIYGALAQDFEKAQAQLLQMYPHLCR